MTKLLNLEFEKDGYKCYASVSYSTPIGKWTADSDVDYEGGYDILDLLILDENGDSIERSESTITYDDIFREFELMDEFEGDIDDVRIVGQPWCWEERL